jgi:DNA-binding PadR family transcriptional regulator
MEYSNLTDLEILTAAEANNLPLLTRLERHNYIKQLKTRSDKRKRNDAIKIDRKWLQWFQSKKKIQIFL